MSSSRVHHPLLIARQQLVELSNAGHVRKTHTRLVGASVPLFRPGQLATLKLHRTSAEKAAVFSRKLSVETLSGLVRTDHPFHVGRGPLAVETGARRSGGAPAGGGFFARRVLGWCHLAGSGGRSVLAAPRAR